MVGSYESLLKTLQTDARFSGGEGNVFLIGPTKIGKTTLALQLCFEEPDVFLQPVQASKWIKERYRADQFASYEAYVEFLTAKSQELLLQDPLVCVNRVRQSFNACGGGCMIEGIRNPTDFVSLFDCRKDLVVFLTRNGLSAVNEFEQGIEVIRSYVGWLEANFGTKVAPFAMEVQL